MAGKLGVEIMAGDDQLPAEDLTNALIARAKEAGKTEQQIAAALE